VERQDNFFDNTTVTFFISYMKLLTGKYSLLKQLSRKIKLKFCNIGYYHWSQIKIWPEFLACWRALVCKSEFIGLMPMLVVWMNVCWLFLNLLSLKGFSCMSFNFAWNWADSPNDASNDFGSKRGTDLFQGSFWCKMLELGSKHGKQIMGSAVRFIYFICIYNYLYINFIHVC